MVIFRKTRRTLRRDRVGSGVGGSEGDPLLQEKWASEDPLRKPPASASSPFPGGDGAAGAVGHSVCLDHGRKSVTLVTKHHEDQGAQEVGYELAEREFGDKVFTRPSTTGSPKSRARKRPAAPRPRRKRPARSSSRMHRRRLPATDSPPKADDRHPN